MKIHRRIFCLLLAVCLCFSLAACGKAIPQETDDDTTAAETTQPEPSIPAAPEAADSLLPEPQKSARIDLDLTKLSSTMVYAEVYNMTTSPEEYIGKTVKMTGSFTIFQATDDYGQVIPDSLYFACIIADAAACCAQGIEFVLEGDYSYPKVEVEISDGNYDEIRDWIIHGQVDCGFLSRIVADELKFYPLWDDPLCAVLPENHPLTMKENVSLQELFRYPLIIETPGCDNDIQHLMQACAVKPNIAYSFRDDAIIMSFVRSGLGVTISQELVLKAFGQPGVVSRPLKPACCRTIGLAFSKAPNSVVSQTLLGYLQKYGMVL